MESITRVKLVLLLVFLASVSVSDAIVAPDKINDAIQKLEALVQILPGFIVKLKSRASQMSSAAAAPQGVTMQGAQGDTRMLWSDLKMVQLLGKQYYVSTDLELIHENAFTWCKDHGLQLLSIETAAENKAVEKILKKVGSYVYWTSGVRTEDKTKVSFMWKSTGAPFSYTNFFKGEPKGREARCVAADHWMSGITFGWVDHDCNVKRKFACEEA